MKELPVTMRKRNRSIVKYWRVNEYKAKLIKDKRGNLLGEFSLKTVISIISILLLVFLLFNIYSTFSDKSDLKKAEGSLERVDEKINEAAKNGVAEDVLYEPKKWALLHYAEGGPNSCLGKACICICAEPGLLSFKKQIEKCNSAGACKNLKEKVIGFEKIKIDGATGVIFKKEEGGISIREK